MSLKWLTGWLQEKDQVLGKVLPYKVNKQCREIRRTSTLLEDKKETESTRTNKTFHFRQ